MHEQDLQIRYGRLADGLTDIEQAFVAMVQDDFGQRVTALLQRGLDVTTPIRNLNLQQTHVFEAEYLSLLEDDGFRLRFDFFNKQTAVLEVSTAFTHGWHSARFSPKHYHNPRLVRPAIDEFLRLAREQRGEDALKAFETTVNRLLSPEFMKHYKLHVEHNGESEPRMSLMWFPHDYDGLVMRIDLWLVTPTKLDEEDGTPKKYSLH